MSFRWTRGSPEALERNIGLYGQRALVAVHAVAVHWGQSVQDEARASASWEDRTGNARGGLFFAVDGFGFRPITGHVSVTGRGARERDEQGQFVATTETVQGSKSRLIVTLGHTVYYGRFLELSRGGRYAVVMSTLERNLPRLERMLRTLLR